MPERDNFRRGGRAAKIPPLAAARADGPDVATVGADARCRRASGGVRAEGVEDMPKTGGSCD